MAYVPQYWGHIPYLVRIPVWYMDHEPLQGEAPMDTASLPAQQLNPTVYGHVGVSNNLGPFEAPYFWKLPYRCAHDLGVLLVGVLIVSPTNLAPPPFLAMPVYQCLETPVAPPGVEQHIVGSSMLTNTRATGSENISTVSYTSKSYVQSCRPV